MSQISRRRPDSRLYRFLSFAVVALSLSACAQRPAVLDRPAPITSTIQPVAPSIEVYFSPQGGCTAAVVRELDAAKESVLVQAYSFTSAPIAKALLEAHKRGVKVQVILDKSQRTEKYSSATFLKNVGIPVFIDDKHAIAHNKVMVIDGAVVITGSFNFTTAAEEHNAENLLVIRDSGLAGSMPQTGRNICGIPCLTSSRTRLRRDDQQ